MYPIAYQYQAGMEIRYKDQADTHLCIMHGVHTSMFESL